jgi:hypothetical protein
MSNMMNVPGDLDDVTADWMTDALAEAQPGTVVSSIAIEQVIHGSLTKVLLAIDFAANPHAIPSSLYLKAAFEDHGIPTSVRSEAVFYAIGQPEVDMSTPEPYAAVYDDEHGVVVMENVVATGATITDPRVGWSVDLVADGLAQLASLHARWWGDGRVPGIPDFEGSNALGAILMAEGYWESCVGGPTGVHVPEAFRDRERSRPMVEELWRLDTERPLAFCHGDAHLGNTFVTADGGAGFLDWGGVKAGHWAREVCYFLAGALDPEDRRTHEVTLLEGYLAALVAYGVVDPPNWDDAWLSYRRHYLHGLLWFLCPTQMQPVDIINANVERFAVACTDHDVATLF